MKEITARGKIFISTTMNRKFNRTEVSNLFQSFVRKYDRLFADIKAPKLHTKIEDNLQNHLRCNIMGSHNLKAET